MANIAEEQKRSSLMLDCDSKPYLLKKGHSFFKRDWSLLPDELLLRIISSLHWVDVVHARSVCSSWRSAIPFPSCLLRPRYSLPKLVGSEHLCILEKVPLYLFRVLTLLPIPAVLPSEYFLGGISQEDRMELVPSSVQCSVKVKIAGSEPIVMKMRDCQIIPLGYQYRRIGFGPQEWEKDYRGAAYLPLNKEGGFVVFLNYTDSILVLRSAEMRWIQFGKISDSPCQDLVGFKGKFYAVFLNGEVFVIDPYSLEATPLIPSEPRNTCNYLVPCDNDELFLVEKIIPIPAYANNSNRLKCRVSRLDEESGKWDVVNDLGDRVLFIGKLGNVSCSATELPRGCGMSGNSILFTSGPEYVSLFYRYGVRVEFEEENPNLLRLSRDNRVTILNKAAPVVALRVEC